ncbi:hypothetical protein HanRHA438_Chr09g0395031 [Helianthus annuus]|nr:hypothetical protein HanRHA438_Chr09g0395031 [Helianthus annuus]
MSHSPPHVTCNPVARQEHFFLLVQLAPEPDPATLSTAEKLLLMAPNYSSKIHAHLI